MKSHVESSAEFHENLGGGGKALIPWTEYHGLRKLSAP